MTPLENLPEIEFVDSDKETVLAELVNLFTAITGRTSVPGLIIPASKIYCAMQLAATLTTSACLSALTGWRLLRRLQR